MFEIHLRVYFGATALHFHVSYIIPFNLFIFSHGHNLTRAHHHCHHRTRPSKSPLQNLVLYARATKFHFSWSKMAKHKSRSRINNLCRSLDRLVCVAPCYDPLLYLSISRVTSVGLPNMLTCASMRVNL